MAYRYVIATSSRTRRSGNQVAVFTDAREIPEDKLQPIAREMNFSETVFVYKPEGEGHARIRIFTPRSRCRLPGTRRSAPRSSSARRSQLEEIELETGWARPRPARARRGRIVFGRMEQPLPTVEAYEGEEELLGDPGRRALGAPGRGLRQRRPARLCRRSAPRTRSRRCARTSARSPGWRRARRQLLRGLGGAAGRRGCSRRPAACRGSGDRARRPGRWRSTSPGTAGSRSATRSRSRRASRSGGPRSSTRGSTARRRGRARRGRRLGGHVAHGELRI